MWLGMLRKVPDQIAWCYQRARECCARAADGTNEADKQGFLDLERRWLILARSYEMSEQFTDFTNEVARKLHVFRPPEPRHPAIPRVRCPECGKQMRLAYSEPHPDERRFGDLATMTCSCGYTLQLSTHRSK